jgi:hypothetical protein
VAHLLVPLFQEFYLAGKGHIGQSMVKAFAKGVMGWHKTYLDLHVELQLPCAANLRTALDTIRSGTFSDLWIAPTELIMSRQHVGSAHGQEHNGQRRISAT